MSYLAAGVTRAGSLAADAAREPGGRLQLGALDRSIVADTAAIGFTEVTGGSRVTFATGMAVIEASEKLVEELRARAALIWDVDVDGVVWEDGEARPASSNVGDFPPLSFKELAAKRSLTGGPTTAAASADAGGMAPGFSTQFCDVEVDPETGKVTILRFVATQDFPIPDLSRE